MDVIKNFSFSPAVMGSLLYGLTRAPEQYRTPLLTKLSEYVSFNNIHRGITALKWLFALGLLRNAHVFLSDIAQNNFRIRSEKHRYVWSKEVAVVTGAASGFGALIAKDLASQGINVMALDIRDELPVDMRNIKKIHYFKCDISDRQAVMDLAKRIEKEHGEVSILINNAGVCYQHTILDASEKALNNLYAVNVLSHYWTLQAFMPTMVKNKKGHVVATASIGSFVSGTPLIPYCNTKAAVLSLHEGIQQEMRAVYKTPEIKFSVVHPTYAATAMAAGHAQELRDAGAFVLDPQVVADAVVKQVLSGKGRQIVLAGSLGFVSTMRAWPHWITNALLRLGDGQAAMFETGTEKRAG